MKVEIELLIVSITIPLFPPVCSELQLSENSESTFCAGKKSETTTSRTCSSELSRGKVSMLIHTIKSYVWTFRKYILLWGFRLPLSYGNPQKFVTPPSRQYLVNRSQFYWYKSRNFRTDALTDEHLALRLPDRNKRFAQKLLLTPGPLTLGGCEIFLKASGPWTPKCNHLSQA